MSNNLEQAGIAGVLAGVYTGVTTTPTMKGLFCALSAMGLSYDYLRKVPFGWDTMDNILPGIVGGCFSTGVTFGMAGKYLD